MPTLAGCLWVVANYYDHWAEEPVLGHYAIPMLATGLSMLGCMMIGAMGFDKARVSTTLAFSLSGASVCIMALADAEVAEIDARPGSKITKADVKDLHLSHDMTLAGLVRDGKGMLIDGRTRIQPGDHVVVFCLSGSIHRVEKLFI